MSNLNIKYRGKIATTEDIKTIKQVIKDNPLFHRTALSKHLCEIWNWRQVNGALRDMVCRGFLLALERAGYITLPAKRRYPNNPFVNRKKPAKIEINSTPYENKVSLIRPLLFTQVRYTKLEKLFNSLIEEYHYLGYCHPVGEQLKYIIFKEDKPIACFAWSSAVRHIESRDKYIGWDQNIRKKNLHLMAYNTRFLILPWINVRYLASHLLSEMTKLLPVDWNRIYKHPIYYLETFVDKSLFKGTCYSAANWVYLGDTKGLGKDSQTKKVNRSIKAVWGYPLVKDFKKRLCSEEK